MPSTLKLPPKAVPPGEVSPPLSRPEPKPTACSSTTSLARQPAKSFQEPLLRSQGNESTQSTRPLAAPTPPPTLKSAAAAGAAAPVEKSTAAANRRCALGRAGKLDRICI